MRRILLAFLATSVLHAGANAQGDVQLGQENVNGFRNAGVDASTRREGRRTILDVVVRMQDFLALVPHLQARGLLNRDITETALRMRRFTAAGVFGQQGAVALLLPLYQNNREVDAATVRVATSFPDDYGHLRRETLVSFDFDRRLFERIKWENFETHHLVRIAPNYRTTPFFSLKLNEESR